MQVGLTPVIIADEVEWSDAAAVEAERASLAAALEQWRADWESRDTERYLAHYSPRFAAAGQDLAAWARAQAQGERRPSSGSRSACRSVAMFRYPRERDFVVVTFDQDYRSNGLSNVMRKRQYWVKEGGRWKIIYEGAGMKLTRLFSRSSTAAVVPSGALAADPQVDLQHQRRAPSASSSTRPRRRRRWRTSCST